MDLDGRIGQASDCAHNLALEDTESERNGEAVESCLRKSDALAIAKEYAGEVAKKQREICANKLVYFLKDEGEIWDNEINIIKNAPLATEVE